jgi:hypothetical protein
VLLIEPRDTGKYFSLGAVGLSLEASELRSPTLSASHDSLVALMRRLGPGVLRIGGNTLDSSWWTSNDEPPPAWATNVVDPSDLVVLRGLLAATNWRVILGVNLGHFDPARAASEAFTAAQILGTRLLGIEVGNEPNAYTTPAIKLRPSSYGIGGYLEELAAYSASVRAAVPQIRVYGPDVSSQAWLQSIASAKGISLSAITVHYYPTFYSVANSVCSDTSLPTAGELLSPEIRGRENEVLQSIVHAGEVSHLETRISETNTTADCGDTAGGPATSPVFASALWSLDWVLRSASAGVAGLNFHGSLGPCTPIAFSPICAPGASTIARTDAAAPPKYYARPEYYGLLAARQLEGGTFLRTALSGSSTLGDLTTYATIHANGDVTVAIDNFDAAKSASLLLTVPGYHEAASETLVGPSIYATNDVTFGHAAFDALVTRRATQRPITKSGGSFPLHLKAASAMIVSLRR